MLLENRGAASLILGVLDSILPSPVYIELSYKNASNEKRITLGTLTFQVAAAALLDNNDVN